MVGQPGWSAVPSRLAADCALVSTRLLPSCPTLSFVDFLLISSPPVSPRLVQLTLPATTDSPPSAPLFLNFPCRPLSGAAVASSVSLLTCLSFRGFGTKPIVMEILFLRSVSRFHFCSFVSFSFDACDCFSLLPSLAPVSSFVFGWRDSSKIWRLQVPLQKTGF